MINHLKRRTLKAALAIAGTAVTGLSSAAALSPPVSDRATTKDTTDLHRGFDITTRHNPNTNDIDIVITNTDDKPVTITRVFPDSLSTTRGTFKTSIITANGPVTLNSQQSVAVPLTHDAMNVFRQSRTLPTTSVRQAVRQQMGLVVNHNQMATLTVRQTPAYA